MVMKSTTAGGTAADPKHSRAAIRIAQIITGGTYGSRKRYPTTYGRKTVQGLADLIDGETGLPELLRDCRELLEKVQTEHEADHQDGLTEHGFDPGAQECPVCARLVSVEELLNRIEGR